ncbi:MAG: helix-turn-helix transcriptional regulator [Phycisphaeraceae bacterium]|nr:helix-turn-helix transcriptional regulator [Phycisphaeraceae bacterium]
MRTATRSRSRPKSRPHPAAQHAPFEGFLPEEVAIAQRVRQVCQGRSVWGLENELGVSRENIRRVMHGASRPSARLLVAICERLGVSADWLLLGRGAMTCAPSARPRERSKAGPRSPIGRPPRGRGRG